jgi:beta-mannosidase
MMKSFLRFTLIACLIASHFVNARAEFITKFELRGSWKFHQVGKQVWMDAIVPGCVHSDLYWNKKIEDPYSRNNEKFIQWIDTADWEYKMNFRVTEDVSKKENIELIFYGLDTYADIYINGTMVKSTDNMFRTWTLECKKQLKFGENELRIYFHSPVKAAMKERDKLSYKLPSDNDDALRMFVRKAAVQFGSDFSPRFITSGIWRPIFIKGWNTAKIDEVNFRPNDISPTKAAYTANIDITADKETDLRLGVFIDDEVRPIAEIPVKLKVGANNYSIPFQVDNPKLWWPNGLGDHYLYRFKARLISGEFAVDEIIHQIGIRTLKLIEKPDADGSSFYFEVNGSPVFIKGANWSPADVLPSKIIADKYSKLISDAANANINLLRVWGGGIYEDPNFYKFCAENGILVWQDFMFSSSMYPGDEKFLDNIKLEATEIVKRLRDNPSLALWCGNNDILDSWTSSDWQKKYGLSANDAAQIWKGYEKIFYNLLPGIVKELNPETSYHASSPSSPQNKPGTLKSGDVHNYDPWYNGKPLSNYQKNVPRFMSEYGFQSFPSMLGFKQFSKAEDWSMTSSVMNYRQKATVPVSGNAVSGNKIMEKTVNDLYQEPTSFENLVYLSQLNQSHLVKTAIEAQRRAMPYCMGSIYRQLNDCWPAISFSGIDYYGHWKALQYKVKKAYNNVLVSPVTDSTDVKVYIISDKLKPVDATLSVRMFDFTGKVLYKEDVPIKIDPNTSKVYYTKPEKTLLGKGNKTGVVLNTRLMLNDSLISSNNLFFAPPKNLKLPATKIKKEFVKIKGGYDMVISSKVFAKDAYLTTDNQNGFFTDNFFDLLPGEPMKIKYYGDDMPEFLEKTFRVMSVVDSY